MPPPHVPPVQVSVLLMPAKFCAGLGIGASGPLMAAAAFLSGQPPEGFLAVPAAAAGDGRAARQAPEPEAPEAGGASRR